MNHRRRSLGCSRACTNTRQPCTYVHACVYTWLRHCVGRIVPDNTSTRSSRIDIGGARTVNSAWNAEDRKIRAGRKEAWPNIRLRWLGWMRSNHSYIFRRLQLARTVPLQLSDNVVIVFTIRVVFLVRSRPIAGNARLANLLSFSLPFFRSEWILPLFTCSCRSDSFAPNFGELLITAHLPPWSVFVKLNWVGAARVCRVGQRVSYRSVPCCYDSNLIVIRTSRFEMIWKCYASLRVFSFFFNFLVLCVKVSVRCVRWRNHSLW